jgi:Tol biopolymer transport system component
MLTNFGGVDSVELRLVPVPPDPGRPTPTILRGMPRPAARISPDGRWLAYVAAQAGVREVFVQPFPGPGGRRQVSSGGGVEPVWAPDGRSLYYRGGPALLAATLATTPELAVLRRDTLFAMDTPEGGVVAAYDVTPDGERFVFPQYSGSDRPPVVVLHWADELRRRLARRP